MSLVLCPCCCKPILQNNVNISIGDKKQFRHELLLCHLCCNFCQLNHSTRLPRIYTMTQTQIIISIAIITMITSYTTEDIIVDFDPLRNTEETDTNLA